MKRLAARPLPPMKTGLPAAPIAMAGGVIPFQPTTFRHRQIGEVAAEVIRKAMEAGE